MRSLTILLLASALVCRSADQLVGGPYVVTPAARAATVGWVVQTGTVKAGTEPGKAARSAPVLRGEKVSMTGLKAGETIYYEIPGDAPLAERTGHFKVAPTGPADFQFVVFGDTRTRDDLHRRVVQAIVEHTNPDFVLHTGDLVYDGYESSQWPNFFQIERELLKKAVFFPVLGNHERDNARFYEFFDVKTPYYSFNWGSAHFVMLDTDVTNVAVSSAERERFWSAQLRWLEQDLQKAEKADFRFLVMHHPPMTANPAENHQSKDTPDLIPICEKYKVTAAFGGHDHNYQHHLLNRIHYIVTGGGGAPLASVDKPIQGITQKVEKTEHYLTVSVEGKSARVVATALDGHTIDTIDLRP